MEIDADEFITKVLSELTASLEGPLREVKARTRQRKLQYLGFRPFYVTLGEVLWAPQDECGWIHSNKRSRILVS